MRLNFAQIVRSGGIDIQNEYNKLRELFFVKNIQVSTYTQKSIRDIVSENFRWFHFRGTCLSLDEFDKRNGFVFNKQLGTDNIDCLVSFAEYIYNMINELNRIGQKMFLVFPFDLKFVLEHIERVIESIGYMRLWEDGIIVFVEKCQAAVAVAEILPEPVSYKVIFYNHHSMVGDIEAKKAILLQLASLLEPKDEVLRTIDSTFKSDLFYAFNNLNLRHNNIDPTKVQKYKKKIAEMPSEELEKWYDEVYQMCLLAFLRIEHVHRKKDFDELKTQIEAQ